MLTVAPMSVVLMGLFGLALVVASVARVVVLEHAHRVRVPLAGPESYDRPRVTV